MVNLNTANGEFDHQIIIVVNLTTANGQFHHHTDSGQFNHCKWSILPQTLLWGPWLIYFTLFTLLFFTFFYISLFTFIISLFTCTLAMLNNLLVTLCGYLKYFTVVVSISAE